MIAVLGKSCGWSRTTIRAQQMNEESSILPESALLPVSRRGHRSSMNKLNLRVSGTTVGVIRTLLTWLASGSIAPVCVALACVALACVALGRVTLDRIALLLYWACH